jgi:hypothetical protein
MTEPSPHCYSAPTRMFTEQMIKVRPFVHVTVRRDLYDAANPVGKMDVALSGDRNSFLGSGLSLTSSSSRYMRSQFENTRSVWASGSSKDVTSAVLKLAFGKCPFASLFCKTRNDKEKIDLPRG